jgi:predicted DNA-binding protein (MmcQ/YjbR family)
MTPKQIDAFCSKLPAATRTVQWEGVIVFKVGGKMFCLIAPPDH